MQVSDGGCFQGPGHENRAEGLCGHGSGVTTVSELVKPLSSKLSQWLITAGNSATEWYDV